MEFEWSIFRKGDLSENEIAESFEDPFSLRFLPDSNRFAAQNRFLSLGYSNNGKAIFAVYSSTGKTIKVLAARAMSEDETYFYKRKTHDNL